MLTAPAPPRPARPRPGSGRPAPTRQGVAQRRTVAALGTTLSAVVVAGVATGAESAWIGALVLAALTAGYVLAVVRCRRGAARREMTAAFGPEDPLDWDSLPEGLSGLALPSGDGPAGGEPVSRSGRGPVAPVGTGFDRELVAFLGAWVLGLVLTPVVALIRIAGLDLSDPRRRGLVGALVRAQAYGRSQSLKVVAAGLFATAGVTAVAAGGTASAAPVASAALRTVVTPEGGTGLWAAPTATLARWGPDAPAPPSVAAGRVGGQASLLVAEAKHHHHKHHHVRHDHVSTAAEEAVRVALAQVGKPYVYGAAGPYAFDCSGLIMYSWGAAGVWLPHYSVAQYDVTTHIAGTQLRPGDLVFYDNYYGAQPGHVAMYIGGGQVVSANYTGTNVQTQSIAWDGVIMGYGRVG